MIQHVVLFRLKDTSAENVQKTKEILLSMDGNVPMLRGIQVGVDLLHSGRSFDIGLFVKLDDMAALEAYQNDPYHCSVVKKHMHAVRSDSVAIDFEI